jgi:hypothetical protein
MKKRFRGAFVLIPVVYAGVILLLLFLQFSDGQRFYESTNGLTLEGRMTPTVERESSTVASARLSFRGLAFEFDEDTPLRVRTADGDNAALAPRAYTREENGFRLRFENDASLIFELSGPDGGELRVRPQIPSSLQPARSLTLPVRTTGGASLQDTTLPGIYPVRFESATYHLAPPPEARFDGAAGVLEVPIDGATQTVRYVQADTPQQDVFTTWFSDDRLAIGDAAYTETVSAFIDEAYRGWTQTRFNGGSGTWDMRSGSPVFSERILTATLAEAWRRNEYTPVFTDMRRAADQHAGMITLLSAPFLGNLREIRAQYLEADRQRTARLLELARAGNPEIFRTPDLAQFAIDRGSTELSTALLEFVGEVDYLEAEMGQVLGMLRNYYLADFPNAETAEVFARFTAAVEARVLPNLFRAQEAGFFLRSGPGRVDVFESILAGRILEAAGAERGDERLVTVGRNLVSSALALSDGDGFVPAVLYVGDDGLEGVEGALGPERFYEILSDNPAYPRQISLAEEIGRGTWMWTVAQIVDIDADTERHRFTIAYPRNRTHYIILQGIPTFTGMELFGQQWRNDPSFESYIKGRHYNPRTDTLMIKYTDNSVQGDIILEY